jgi:H+/Cl- antiporter ClcA
MLRTILRFVEFLKWFSVALAVAALAGTASAALLFSLEWATRWREGHEWMLVLLPVAGFGVAWAYHRWGRSVERGNNLLIEEINDPKALLPGRMAPMIFVATVVSHLTGASVGREGTAVQMGGSLADRLTRPFGLGPRERSVLVACGVSAGFGSVFGVPLAGAIFGLEVLAVGHMRYDALFPCLIASLGGDWVARAWGAHHAEYLVGEIPDFGPAGLFKAITAGILFGLMALAFVTLTHTFGSWFKRLLPDSRWRAFWGGAALIFVAVLLGATAYLGLSLPLISAAFTGGSKPWDFAAKTIFTTFSLGVGFKGGEVTPLFLVGAGLGATLAPLLALPGPLLASMGFAAVFGAAANTPLTALVMAFELFGAKAGVYAAIACVLAYLCSGHGGIYPAQKKGAKHFGRPPRRVPETGQGIRG